MALPRLTHLTHYIMSPLYAIHSLRQETLRELNKATSPVIRNALEMQLQALTRRENAVRVQISLSRNPVHTPAPTRCAFNFSHAPHILPSGHWSFDEEENSRNKAINATARRLQTLFGSAPRHLVLALHTMGGVRQALKALNLEVFLELPPAARLVAGPRILEAIHTKLTS